LTTQTTLVYNLLSDFSYTNFTVSYMHWAGSVTVQLNIILLFQRMRLSA